MMFEWHKKEAPVFTGVTRGVGGFGFGKAATATAGPVDTFATGGIIADISGGYRLHAFTQPGTFTVPSQVFFSSAEILMLGGGGGGGNTIGGGGGSGGAVYHPSYPITAGTPIAVTVGSGGAGSPTPGSAPTPSAIYASGRGTPGGNTVFGLLTANAGGGGGNYSGASNDAGPGGSSGGLGGAANGTVPATQPSQPQGIAGFTQSGGVGADSPSTNVGGGGGGAGGGGSEKTGGPGVVYPQFSGYLNTSGTFGGGGGGGTRTPSEPTAGSGGAGGGGNGGAGTSPGFVATHGTGSGGGAGGYSDANDIGASGARGGNGVVLIRYAYPTPITSATAKGHSTPMSGGTQWFSSTPNHFGVDLDSEYQLANGSTYKTVTYRRTSTSAYSWWILFSSKSGNDYTPVFGARIPVSAGGSVGDTLTTNLIQAAEVFGDNTIPSSGTYYISWLSGSPNYTASSGPIYADATSGGSVNYVQTNTFPSTSVTYTTTSGNTGSKIHIALS